MAGPMAEQIFLIAPPDADAATVASRLENAVSAAPVSVLLVPIGGRSEPDYSALINKLVPLAQSQGVAVLVENRPGLVRTLGADGVHMTGGIKGLREAVETLKPDFIVGTGDIGTRHEAMVRGELDVDYLLFGDRAESDWEMADWWAETFEVPSVYLAASTADPAIKTVRAEFIALAGDDWDAPEKLSALIGVPA